jgi:dihydrofolate synthase / folylpolyglutamate synthase
MSYEKALEYIYSREKFGIKLGLKNIKDLVKSLGNPQDSFKSIHVAGTNGKGSTTAFISSILISQGYKVGVYTSPHLIDFRERIRINSELINKKDVINLISKIKQKVNKHTYFEIVTALALLYFKEKKIDFAIIEVGLGGRLDATNVINPLVSVITNISLEHTNHLGNTINEISYEKAGIIKPNVPIVVLNKCKGLDVIKKIALKKKAKLCLAKTKKIKTSLKGTFQYQNASVALKVIEILKAKKNQINKKAIKEGFKCTKWPGRFEFVTKNLIFDCAHNTDAIKTLVQEIKKLGYKKIYVVLGIMKDKDIKNMVFEISKIATEVIVTKPQIDRAASYKDISKFVKSKCVIVENIKDSIEYARFIAGLSGLVVVTGSIFTVGEAYSSI